MFIAMFTNGNKQAVGRINASLQLLQSVVIFASFDVTNNSKQYGF